MADPDKISRRELRAKVMQALYAHDMTGDPISHLRTTVLADIKESTTDYDYAARMLNVVINKPDEINEWLLKHTNNWDMARIAVIDLILLKMGTAEFLFFPDIPPKVTMNELLEIAKSYSTDQSNKFINGVLDAVLEDLKKQGKIEKTGRGLINS
ncbi:MAG: transcription antitermination factor NusB [Bacteroidetes bacterium]|nr:transcription antitermination factor NusB [Bacteroidota bacterium]